MLAIEVVLETCSKFAGYLSYQNRQTKAFYALPPDCDLPGLVEVYEFRKEADEVGWIEQVVLIPFWDGTYKGHKYMEIIFAILGQIFLPCIRTSVIPC